jgi:protein tyrosine/serine phosphatase
MSSENTPEIAPEPQRFISFEGCVNFRDLGGYPTRDGRTVKWRKLYRSDALNELTPGDVYRALGELGLGTMLDLRNREEASRDGTGVLPANGLDYHHFPLLEERGEAPPMNGADIAERLSDTYQWIIHNSGEMLAEAVTIISQSPGNPGRPGNRGSAAVFHCSAGKDRTGIIAALILGVLEVEHEVVMADYLLTNDVAVAIFQRIRRMQPQYEYTQESMRAHPLAMEQFQETLHSTYGGPEQYLRSHGVSPDAFQSLRAALLDD